MPPPPCSPLETLPPPGAATGEPREPGEGGVGSCIKIRKPLWIGLILWELSAALLFFELLRLRLEPLCFFVHLEAQRTVGLKRLARESSGYI